MTAYPIQPSPISPLTRRENAERVLLGFLGAAVVTGAIPVPAASVAVVAENAAMVNAVAAAMGVPVSVGTVAASLGPIGVLNLVGKTLFMEGARFIGWFATPLTTALVCALGASTAGIQTWILGRLTIAICENGGAPLSGGPGGPGVQAVIAEAKATFTEARERARTSR